MNFLIVDDCDINNLVMEKILQHIIPDCNITIATSGYEAITKFNSMDPKPDMIFTDYSMPPFNGDKVIHTLKTECNYKGPIILVTAYLKHEIPKCGYDEFVDKPILIDNMKLLLNKYIST